MTFGAARINSAAYFICRNSFVAFEHVVAQVRCLIVCDRFLRFGYSLLKADWRVVRYLGPFHIAYALSFNWN